jgi:tetratricopeptide (TPR) repeat protein
MFELKPISPDSVEGALAKAERYRLLNEPSEAESICRDILEIDPKNRQARISLILALTDEIPQEASSFTRAMEAIPTLESAYDRAYYSGIAWERRAKALYGSKGPGSSGYVHDWIVKALQFFEEAEHLRPEGNDSSILRWNACVRFLEHHKELAPKAEDAPEPILSE